MKGKILSILLIVLMMGMSVAYAATSLDFAQTDEELIGVGIITYGLVHLYEGMYEWGFMPIPGLSGSSAGDGSFSYRFSGVDPDGDGQFILDGTNKATLSGSKIHETLEITIRDGSVVSYTIYITATGSADEDLALTYLKINGKSFTQEQIEVLFEDEEDFSY